MIVYQGSKQKFLDDVLTNNIGEIILDFYKKKTGKGTSASEIASWQNSMMFMNNVLIDPAIPAECKVSIEYHLPQTSKRVDFILTGKDDYGIDHAVLVELKQWSTAENTGKDGVVSTFMGGGNQEVAHPSYKVWSYAAYLNGFSETVYKEDIQIKPCAYLHNYVADGIINGDFYAEYIEKAPIFLKEDAIKLREFIKQFVKHGDSTNILYRIDQGRVRPSKALADNLASMLKGNQEYVMLDDQKVVFETALQLAQKSSDTNKNVLIVEGGPGTGKSVVAINLLVALTKLGLIAQYVTKNAAPRTVYESKLTGTLKKTEISNLFKSSGAYIDSPESVIDALIVDEAHRLNHKSGMFKNLGDSQIKEIITASKFSVFFVDEDQKVTLCDVGEKEEITNWAEIIGAKVHHAELTSQFRCNGSDGYLSWLDNVLQIKETANEEFDSGEYDFKIIESPSVLRDLIFEKNKLNNKARLVAGYCWNWVSKNNPTVKDIEFPEYGFAMRWNLASDGNHWILKEEAVNEVGCIHTCQGLEVDYIGVIVGPDFVVRNGRVITDALKRARSDSSVRGCKKLLKEKPGEAEVVLDKIIKNTYRTLMTRGMKGCYVYFTDKETEQYFKDKLKQK